MNIEQKNLVILDIGSRGEIPLDWNWFLENKFKLKIHTFDIDLDVRIVEKEQIIYENHKFGLSSTNKSRDFYLCEDKSQSSCFKPNDKIKIFEEKHYKKRLNYKKSKMNNISTIDSIFQGEKNIDFIKCDTQGSEYDITIGAKNTLKNLCPIVALETWCEDIYKEMPLDFDIRSLYREIGYKLFDTDIAAAWRYKSNNLFPLSKQRLIGENLLFVPSMEMFDNISNENIKNKIPILCFYGFYDYAYNLIIRRNIKSYLPILRNLYKKFEASQRLDRRILNKIKGGRKIYPRIT